MNWFQAKAYINYRRKAKYKKGHRIHPPFAFDIVRHDFYENDSYYHFDLINKIRKDLLEDRRKVDVNDLGAGSKKFSNKLRRISSLVKYNATPRMQGELISRLIARFKPQNIIELGTSLGLGTLYLAMPNSRASVFTVEGCSNIAAVAENTFKKAQATNIRLLNDSFENALPKLLSEMDQVDMVYFDGNHSYDATISYFNMCLAKASDSALFIFDDIHWSKGMEQAWNEIIDNNKVSVSFDLFRFGIAIINKDVLKQHYIVKWP
ncbi:O-methyltransferase [Plebeiibacterium sediminum]|uniref:Class I SAM-dependent methyltransferase n=1 Tax=Plebeiibacterium sediminum TaxID=2992112 RepID=A0AAE3M2K1_9BACT|nr:class I SAM-dependent methyltransferase [Plebeiobacterium sediminum]MCW3786037.1 class I SAM-dependent methyltransferase [Plebeiobacterium sediminum]